MKLRWIVVVVCFALATVLGVLFWERQTPGRREAVEQPVIGTNLSDIIATQPSAEQRPSPLVQSVEIGKRAIAVQKAAKAMNGPVEFYAKVIDQSGAPVEGMILTASMSVFAEGYWVREDDRVQNTPIQIQSDAAGQLEIIDKHGSTLRILTLEKEGYIWSHPGFGSFAFGMSNRPKQAQDYNNPTKRLIFRAWKKGQTEPVVRQGLRVRLRAEQEVYGLNMLTGQKVSTNDSPDLIIRFRLVDDTNGAARAHRLISFDVPSGGISETTDAYPYAAPAAGYQASWQWVYLATDAVPGKEEWKRNFYLQARNGRLAAGLSVRFDSLPSFEIDVIASPAGSPVLEPDPAKQITDSEEIRRLDETTRQ